MGLKRFLCLVNPLSGGKAGTKVMRTLGTAISKKEFFGEIQAIDFGKLDSQLQQASKFDALIIAGGDGTISSVLAAFADQEIPVGIIPLGTGNDLARALGIPQALATNDPAALVKQYEEAQYKTFQLWNLSCGENFSVRRSFINYLSFGFDASVVHGFATFRKQRLYVLHYFSKIGNRIGYSLCGLITFLRRRPVHLKALNGVNYPDKRGEWSLFFANIKEVMGLGHSNFLSDPLDDKLEGFAIRKFFDYLPFVSIGCFKSLTPKLLGSLNNWHFEFYEAPKVQLDGESQIELNYLEYKINAGSKVKLIALK